MTVGRGSTKCDYLYFSEFKALFSLPVLTPGDSGTL